MSGAEYRDYIEGADLYSINRAASLSWACNSLRDQLTEFTHKSMLEDPLLGLSATNRQEVEKLQLLGARREGYASLRRRLAGG